MAKTFLFSYVGEHLMSSTSSLIRINARKHSIENCLTYLFVNLTDKIRG